jgi:hypothetical protein
MDSEIFNYFLSSKDEDASQKRMCRNESRNNVKLSSSFYEIYQRREVRNLDNAQRSFCHVCRGQKWEPKVMSFERHRGPIYRQLKLM